MKKREKIAELCGVTEEFLSKQEFSPIAESSSATQTLKDTIQKTKRFYFSCVLNELLNEQSLLTVSQRYAVSRGDLQSLLVSAQSWALMTCNFCKTVDYWALGLLLSAYCKRLNFGCKEELLPLTEIKGVKKARARSLYNAGYRSIRSVSQATPEELVRAVNLGPYYADSTARKIIRNAKELLELKAKELREAAEEMLK